MGARQFVSSRCSTYLAYVEDVTSEGPSVDKVSVVTEYANVFPMDLPALLPRV